MENLIFPLIMFPCAASFTALGIYAWKRKKPMWFWSGSEVKAWQIRDIPAYNRANGWMWIGYSLGFWAAAALSLFHVPAAGTLKHPRMAAAQKPREKTSHMIPFARL